METTNETMVKILEDIIKRLDRIEGKLDDIVQDDDAKEGAA